ncbi:Gluconolactonase [Balamuthia mandrillaris]
MDPRTNRTERWLYVGGRPLGLTFSPDAKQLFLADPIQGLVSVDVGSKSIRILTNIAAGSPIRYADDVDVSKTGDQIYFSDASKYPPLLRSHNKAELAGYYDVLATFLVDYFAGVGSGRLLRYTLSTGLTEELVSGIAFCNGVALSRDESFVVFAETSRYRLHRYWLKGPKVGQSEVFVDNLPSMPDGVSLRADGSGHFWVAIPAVSGRADADLVNPYPSIKALLLRMLHLVAPSPPKDTMILEVDEDGNIVRSLASDKLFGITAITEYQPGKLLLGSLTVSSFLPTLLLPQ